jgi:lysophospholipase L1-like esterase
VTDVFAIGDSVMQGAGSELYATLPAAIPGIRVDAAPSRQLKHAAAIIEAAFAAAPPPDVLVIHLGTNGLFADSAFDSLIDAAAGVSTILILTIKAPREWESEVNDRLRRGVARHAAIATMLDWHAAADPDSLKPDGFHLTRPGAALYAELIANALLHPVTVDVQPGL